MKKLYATIIAVLIMAALIPVSPAMAVVPSAATIPQASAWWPHLVFMFAHANILHWLINAWALLILHNLFRPSRLIAAYLFSVVVSFVPAPVESAGLLGSSVITCFFFGFVTPHFWHKERMVSVMMLALIVIGFLIPGIAALHHLLMFVLGIGWFFMERLAYSFRHFCNT